MFTVSVAGASVSLTIYNALGMEVKTLVNGALAPGVYTAHVDGADLFPGAYFYVLRTGNITAARAMLLMK